MIIGFSGKKQSGKDTVAGMFKHYSLNTFQKKQFSHKLKVFCSNILGIPVEQFELDTVKQLTLGPEWNKGLLKDIPLTVRQFLQYTGTSVRDNVHVDFWVNALFTDYKENDDWLITDVRFPNEYERVNDKGGFIIRIERSGLDTSDQHISETALDKGFDFDFTIDNSYDLSYIDQQVKQIIHDIDPYKEKFKV